MRIKLHTTQKRQVVDISRQVQAAIPSGANGLVGIIVGHTTASITTADLDPGTDADFMEFLERLTPVVRWRHPHNPDHAPDHLLASLIGPSVVLPVQDGSLVLGAWQRVVLIELDGPRERKITVEAIDSRAG